MMFDILLLMTFHWLRHSFTYPIKLKNFSSEEDIENVKLKPNSWEAYLDLLRANSKYIGYYSKNRLDWLEIRSREFDEKDNPKLKEIINNITNISSFNSLLSTVTCLLLVAIDPAWKRAQSYYFKISCLYIFLKLFIVNFKVVYNLNIDKVYTTRSYWETRMQSSSPPTLSPNSLWSLTDKLKRAWSSLQ